LGFPHWCLGLLGMIPGRPEIFIRATIRPPSATIAKGLRKAKHLFKTRFQAAFALP